MSIYSIGNFVQKGFTGYGDWSIKYWIFYDLICFNSGNNHYKGHFTVLPWYKMVH